MTLDQLRVPVATPSVEAGLLRQVGRLDLPDRTFCVPRYRERCQSRAADALLALLAVSSMPEPIHRRSMR